MAVSPAPVDSLSKPTTANASVVGANNSPPAPVVPAPTVVPKGPNPNSIVDYLGTIGAPTDLNSRGALAAKLGIVTDPSLYTGSADQNTQLLKMVKAGQGSVTSNSVSAGSTDMSGKALGGAITSALGGAATAPGSTTTAPKTDPTKPDPSKSAPTGSGTVTTDQHVDPNTGAFDSSAYSKTALADAQSSLASTMKTNDNSYAQGKSDLDSQWQQYQDDWQKQKDFATQTAAQYGGSYASEVGEYYDNMLSEKQGTYQSSLADLRTQKQNADLSAQNQFNTDKSTIATNVANFGMNQEQFDLTQSQDLYKNFLSYANTFNFAPTDATTQKLSDAGITSGMDISTLDSSQKGTLLNLAPDFFDAASKAGLSMNDSISAYLGGTFKAQAAQLAAKKEADAAASRDAALQLSVERLGVTASYDQSREAYYNTLGAKAIAAPILGTSGLGPTTAKAISALAQIKAAGAVGLNAASALGALDAYTQAATGGKPTEAQLTNILGGAAYVDRYNALVNKLKGAGKGGIIDATIAQQLDDITTQIAKQRVNQYDISRNAAINAGDNQGYGDSVANFLPDYKGQLNEYLNGALDPNAALDATSGAGNPTTVTSNGQSYNVGQIYNDGTSNWTVDANGTWTQA